MSTPDHTTELARLLARMGDAAVLPGLSNS